MSEPQQHPEPHAAAIPGPQPAIPVPPTRIDAPPIFEIENDPCPKCGTILRPGEVVCVKCGFDLRKNQVHSAAVGVEMVDAATLERARVQAVTGIEPKGGPGEEFSTPGRGNLQTILIFAGALVAAAMVIAGIDAPVGGFLPTVLRALLALYKIVLATGAGVIALVIVSYISDMKFGKPDLATARILLAFAAFHVIQSITFPGPPLLVHLLMWTVALGVYWLLVKILFNKSNTLALYLLATHCLLWLILQGGMSFSLLVHRVEADHAAKQSQQHVPPEE
ncbi:MAG: hypothetical protein H7210_10245 [Pyrinomonadaceae bacterium]|nr:hypothetical protein [Phycisphaerales bacterium]